MKKIAFILGAACLGLAAGCGGPLTVDVMAAWEMHSLQYRLEPTGRLSVSAGGGLVEGRAPSELYQTQLDRPAMNRLKRVVSASGFFFQESPLALTAGGAAMVRMEVTLGLWHNLVETRGQPVASVGKIAGELNRHLPENFRLNYPAGPTGQAPEAPEESAW